MVVSRRYEFPEKINESLKIEFIFQIYRPSLNLVLSLELLFVNLKMRTG